MEQFQAYVESHQVRFLQEYFDLLRMPSIAAQRKGIAETAKLVKRRLEKLGSQDVQFLSYKAGNPVVYGTIGSGNKRLLIYDHYDVQPEDPLDLWVSAPFEPTVRDGHVYARGASDNKGNLMLRLQALEAYMATMGDLPCQIVFVIEGEEEIGSPNLPGFCQKHKSLLKADGCLWETGAVDANDNPVIECGAKGMVYVELTAKGPSTDQHSSVAPIVPNPAWRLTWALATLKSPDGKVLIPGFYDDVRPLTRSDKAALKSLPDNDEALLQGYGITSFVGDVHGTDMWKQYLFEPTCNICGTVAGYTGEGAKTVLPAIARVKLDLRLVPNMDPQKVVKQLRDHLDAQGFADIEMTTFSAVHPTRSDLNSDVVQAMVKSGEATYGVSPVLYPNMAGTGPMYYLCEKLGTPVCSGAGCGYPGQSIHAPNENIRLEDYWRGMEWMGRFVQAFAG